MALCGVSFQLAMAKERKLEAYAIYGTPTLLDLALLCFLGNPLTRPLIF